MKTDYFHKLTFTLKSRLKEEQQNYAKSLKEHREFWELKKIKQKIRSIKNLLQLTQNG